MQLDMAAKTGSSRNESKRVVQTYTGCVRYVDSERALIDQG